MKRYIRSDAEEQKMFNSYLREDEWLPRLKIKAADVRFRVLEAVKPEDKEVFEALVENHVIPTIVTSPDLRNNPYYEMEDKLIRLVSDSEEGFRTYSVPYPGGGRFGYGNIYENWIHVNDDGQIRFGDSSRWIDTDSVKPSTLKNYFFRS